MININENILGARSARKTFITAWEKYDVNFLTSLVRQLCPSDKRFVTGFLQMPDTMKVRGPLDRVSSVNAKTIKTVFQGLTNSPEVLRQILDLFTSR
jgi:hypothetical protein